jgi:glutamate formiminotransferase / 5-formyltetrahydrofolate cyclo-ligase
VAQFSLVHMKPPILLAVPNVSEGRDSETIAAIGRALVAEGGANGGPRSDEQASSHGGGESRTAANGVRLLDTHSDADHHRTVFTLAGRPGKLADALLRAGAAAVERIDVMGKRSGGGAAAGQHPHVGALDVAPVVYLDPRARGAACAEALVVADRIGEELRVPVFLYGELTGSHQRSARTRAELRRGGVAGLAERIREASRSEGGLGPDFGPLRMHPTAGATLVAAREPLVAFNVQLASPATVADARAIAALVREGGAEALPGVRAMGVQLSGGVAQVSMNIERPLEVTLALATEAVGRHAGVDSAELVGLAPRAALEGFPRGVTLSGFDPARHLIENALGF